MKGVFIRAVMVVAVVTAGFMIAAPPVHADTFNLTSCHVDGGCGSQTIFGTVTLTQVGANVNFVVTLDGGNRFVQTGAADQQLFKFNGTGIVAGDIVNEATASPLNAVPTGLNGFAGAFNGSATGTFGFGIACANPTECKGGSTPVFTGLTFTVNNATIAELTVPNSDGNIFVADVLIASNGFTGPVDVSSTPPLVTPEPTTLTLLGTGLLGLGFAARRRLGRNSR